MREGDVAGLKEDPILETLEVEMSVTAVKTVGADPVASAEVEMHWETGRTDSLDLNGAGTSNGSCHLL